MKSILVATCSILLLAACGSEQSPADSAADNLEEAAEYSTPEAADVLDNAADQIRDRNVQDPAAQQEALEAAGNAQAAPPPATTGGQ